MYSEFADRIACDMALSKVSVFDRAMAGVGCQDIYHPGQTCAQKWLTNCIQVAPATGMLVAPLTLVSRSDLDSDLMNLWCLFE